jgi:hypothetical protein
MSDSKSQNRLDAGARSLLRHALATLAYRGGKTVRDANADFAKFELGEQPRTPAQILAHMGDLMDWALSKARGQERWHDSRPLPWDKEVERWFESIGRLDEYLASDAPLQVSVEELFQGPIADSLTHVGQLAMMRRLAGSPIRGENYAVADIVSGRTGTRQSPPRKPFA